MRHQFLADVNLTDGARMIVEARDEQQARRLMRYAIGEFVTGNPAPFAQPEDRQDYEHVREYLLMRLEELKESFFPTYSVEIHP